MNRIGDAAGSLGRAPTRDAPERPAAAMSPWEAGRTDAWRAVPDRPDTEVASWVRALPWVGEALRPTVLKAIEAGLFAWWTLGPAQSERRSEVLDGLGRWLGDAIPGLSQRGAGLLELLRQRVPGLMRENGGDTKAAALQLYRGLERGGSNRDVAPERRDQAPPRPSGPPDAGPRPSAPGRGMPPDRTPRWAPPGLDEGRRESPARAELAGIRRELGRLHMQWQRAPRALSDAQILAGGRRVPETLQRRIDALAAQPPAAGLPSGALAEVRAQAHRLDAAALRYTVHRVIAGHARPSPGALTALRELAQARLRDPDGPGGGDAALLRRLPGTRAPGAQVEHSRGHGATHGEAAGEAALRERAALRANLERARLERLRARHHELPGADRERALEATAARHSVSVAALREALQPGASGRAIGVAAGTAGGTPSAGPAAGGGPSGGARARFVYGQRTQEPQQDPGARAEPRPEQARQRLERFLQSFPEPASHLTVRPGGDGFVVRRDRLNAESRAAYDRLAGPLGEPRLNALANALVIGSRERVGLAALGPAWRGAAGSGAALPALTGSVLSDLGKVVFDSHAFGTLRDLASLTGIETPAGPALLHPTEDDAVVGPWFDAIGDGLLRFHRLPQRPPTQQDLEALPEYLDPLRRIQLRYDSHPVPGPSDSRPWRGSGDSSFRRTFASREAFLLALRSAGLDDAVLHRLPGGSSPTWADAVSAVNALGNLDFARMFDAIDRSMRAAVPGTLRAYDPTTNALHVGIAAKEIADRTFHTPDLRAALFERLRATFVNPDAIRAFGATDDFARVATELATDRVLGNTGPGRAHSWVIAQMREAALGTATLLSRGEAPGGSPSVTRMLERLAVGEGEPERTLRDTIRAQMRQLQSDHGRVLEQVARSLASLGLPAADPSPTQAGSLRDAVGRQLRSAGIPVRLQPGIPDVRPPRFVVEPMPAPPAATGRWAAVGPMRSVLWSEAMDAVIGTLDRAGYPTSWEFDTRAPR